MVDEVKPSVAVVLHLASRVAARYTRIFWRVVCGLGQQKRYICGGVLDTASRCSPLYFLFLDPTEGKYINQPTKRLFSFSEWLFLVCAAFNPHPLLYGTTATPGCGCTSSTSTSTSAVSLP